MFSHFISCNGKYKSFIFILHINSSLISRVNNFSHTKCRKRRTQSLTLILVEPSYVEITNAFVIKRVCRRASRWWETRWKRLLLRDAGKQRAFQQREEAEGGQDRSLAILVSGIRPSTSPPRPAGIARLCAALLPAFAIGVTHRHCTGSALIKCKSELHNLYNALFCHVL